MRASGGHYDASRPGGKTVFTVLGAIAELERSLILERVKAGLGNARAKGKRLGRPKVTADACGIATLRSRGASSATICGETGLCKAVAERAFHSSPKNDLRQVFRARIYRRLRPAKRPKEGTRRKAVRGLQGVGQPVCSRAFPSRLDPGLPIPTAPHGVSWVFVQA